jgi:phage tail tape-measure protein
MNKENTKYSDKKTGTDANRDPITGTPGAHPVGTGVGAASGGAAGAAIGAVAGPVGAAVGLVAGAIAGGLAGKGVAEKVDPTVEDAYWKDNYSKQKYVERNASYDAYRPAYRTGYQGRSQYPGKKYEDVEADLQRDYEKSKGNAGLPWEKAKLATRDAWNRVDQRRPSDTDRDCQ